MLGSRCAIAPEREKAEKDQNSDVCSSKGRGHGPSLFFLLRASFHLIGKGSAGGGARQGLGTEQLER